MCLAIPGKIISFVDSAPLLRMAKVDFGGLVKEISLAYLPEAVIGEYVIVHVGFAISRLDEKEALRTLEVLAELSEIEETVEEVADGEGPEEEAGALFKRAGGAEETGGSDLSGRGEETCVGWKSTER